MSIRAFFAIEIPNKKTLDEIERYQIELQKSIGPLKLVDRKLMHITTRFLGNISENVAKELYFFMESEINNVFFPDGKIITGHFNGVGDFNKRVFFTKIDGDGVMDLLVKINERIEKKLRTFQAIKQENRKYHPHLTIARKKYRKGKSKSKQQQRNPGQKSYAELKAENLDRNFGEWTIKGIVLKKSKLTPKGAIYSNLSF